ncbi:hemolysin family protein [Crocosphaera sp. UHCC 0190]|uniref:hemolysin family protein n=1 Tax=Crocosphaera sp. UHCC 0190 TaxID=3110246 RepID=UPI002B1EED24|nr:hemolysin family protein [Crocosphaera sp. UHCC 0190]MEA5508353.1 hemolysin family protein [Crocosphaera sp. UHCC 0190]
MVSVVSELLVIFLLILINAIFALSEIALLSSRKIRLEQLSLKGDKRAKVALELANDPNQVLSTVQIGITLIGILAGVYGGANLSARLTVILERIPGLTVHSEAIAFTIVVLSLTYLSLVIGELVPKRLALSNPERIASLMAIPLLYVSRLLSPVVNLLGASTNLILSFLGIATTITEPPVTQEEIKVLLKQGREAGMFEKAEHDMVERVLQLGDRKVSTLMTTRPEIIWLNLEDSADINRHKIINSTHTRFPVCQGGLDELLGVVQVTNLLSDCLSCKQFDLTASLRQPLLVPDSTLGLKVLELFQQTGNHIALVVDEYGVIQGLVTINDILEAIVGDIPRIDKTDIPSIIRRDDGSWLMDGIVSIEDFKKVFGLNIIPGETQGNFHTLGGFIITHYGRIPKAADGFEWKNLKFEVMDMDGNRVDKILVTSVNKHLLHQVPNDIY